ncbi:MAG: ABC transporter permease, partial [Terriglobales bacterium]
MSWRTGWARMLGFGRLRGRDRDFQEEMRSHVEHQVEENLAAGMSPKEARRAARIAFGNMGAAAEEASAMWTMPRLESVLSDLKFGSRMLWKSPGFTAVAVFTLALGIGANAALFSVVDNVLLRPLPFRDADRLVDVTTYRPRSVEQAGVAYPDYVAWKQQNTVFDETAAYFLINASNDLVLGGAFSATRARYSIVTNSFFSILGVQPALGRGFSANDEVPGGEKVFLVSNAVWRNDLDGDPRAIGKRYLLDGEGYTLVGVMPRGFDFPHSCGIWLPTSTLSESGLHDRLSHSYHVLGRLRPETNVAQAEAQLETIQKRLGEAYPTTDAGWHVRALPLLDEIIGNVRRSLLVLLAAVAFILLISCTNVVNLMLARASVREREFAIRAALGAGRARLVRQSMTEAFIIVCISSVLAIALAKWGLAITVSATAIQLPRMESFRLNLTVLAFLSAVAVLTTMLVGLVPALQSSRLDSQYALRDGRHGGGGGLRGRRLRGSLVVSEVALALLLLCGAGLMLRSFMRLHRVDPGFRPEHLLTMKLALPSGEYP